MLFVDIHENMFLLSLFFFFKEDSLSHSSEMTLRGDEFKMPPF